MTRDDDATAKEDPTCSPEEREIMAAVDRTGDVSRYVIADISRDDAWVSILKSEALHLKTWR
jgi:hypothetical protein